MGWKTGCYIVSFVVIGPPVPEIFEGFLPYGHGGHLGHVISIMSSDFHFLVPKSFHTKFGSIQFEFLYVHDLGPRSRNDLDLQYSHIFIYSIRCLLLPFRSLAAIVSEKSTVFTFSYGKAQITKFDLAIKYRVII